MLFYELAGVAALLRNNRAGHSVITRPFATRGRVVTGVSGPVSSAGLEPGDQILSLNGTDFVSDRVLFEQLLPAKHGEPLVLVATRGNAQHRVVIPASALLSYPGGAVEFAVRIILVVMLLSCVLVGIYVAAVLPYDLRAIFAFFLLFSASQVISLVSWYQFPRFLWLLVVVIRTTAVASWGLWLILFPLYFPHRFRWDIRRPWLKWIFLAPATAWTVLLSVAGIAPYWNSQYFARLPDLDERVFLSICITFFFASLFFQKAKDADSTRRLRLLQTGSILGLTPLGLFVAYLTATAKTEFNQISVALVLLVCGLFFIFPLSIAYAVVAERAMNVRMVIRQSVRYALTKGVLQLLSGLIIAAIVLGLSNVVFGSHIDSTLKTVIFIVVTIVTVRLFQRARTRLQTAVDKRFFREAYNAQTVLEDLSESVISLVHEDELLETVSRRIADTLHVTQLAILLRYDDGFRSACSIGLESRTKPALRIDAKTVTVLRESKEPARVYFDRPDSWVHDIPRDELVTLQQIHSQLLLPVGVRTKLVGILSLGPKRSEEPYSPSDIHLLRSVMAQTGLALENSRLVSAIAQEVAARELLNRELEIARDVQQRLFPQQTPRVAGIDYCGACRPALLVGGDYYDFLTLSDGNFGIAIGDVSGKGIAAALLMASLQASLRGQAMTNQGDLACLMMNVNRLIYDATPENRYATFFYGQYNRERRVLTYVNAGHNAPVVLRRTSDSATHVIRLETGGTVIGLFPSVPYQQGSLIIEPGDLFLGFTDGISEAMNWKEEEWGEERLIPAVAASRECQASDLIPFVMKAADRFSDGAPQHDDMTLVVLKFAAAA